MVVDREIAGRNATPVLGCDYLDEQIMLLDGGELRFILAFSKPRFGSAVSRMDIVAAFIPYGSSLLIQRSVVG